MISSVPIRNFRSMRELKFAVSRVNVFGEANVGKSNILEALGSSLQGILIALEIWFRVKRISNLFYDKNVDDPILVRCDDFSLRLFRDGDTF